ncbi:MAG: hypothetical protein JST82_03080 [Bacteroidetes bacterium]|nr:hypothetical protein [Bacteroidota bacterium]
MKKILIGCVATLGLATGMVSCQPKAYDANPNKDQKGVLNPLDNTLTDVVYIGTAQGLVNAAKLVFDGYFYVDTFNVRTVVLVARNDVYYHRKITMIVGDSICKGKSNINLVGTYFKYEKYDSTIGRNRVYVLDPVGGNLTITQYADENNTMRGKIYGRLNRTEPEPVDDPTDVAFFDLPFYLEKRGFPLK